MENRKTVGEYRKYLNEKEEYSDNLNDYLEDIMKRQYPKDLESTIEKGCKEYSGDFYIEVCQRGWLPIEGMHRSVGLFMAARKSCPTPNVDRTVFKYHRDSGTYEHMWSLPTIDRCTYLLNNKHLIEPRFYHILQDVMDYVDGKLLIKAKRENNEPLE